MWSHGAQERKYKQEKNSGSHRRNQLGTSSLIYKILQVWFWGGFGLFCLFGWVFCFVFYHTVLFVAEGHQSSKIWFMSLSWRKYLHKDGSVSSLVFKTVFKVQFSDWFSKWVVRNQKIACPGFNLPAHIPWNEVFYNECSWLTLFTFYLYFLIKIQGTLIAN